MSTRKISLYGLKVPLRPPTMQAAVMAVILAMVVLVPLLSGTDALRVIDKTRLFQLLGCLLIALLASQISFAKQSVEALKLRLLVGPTIPVLLLIGYSIANFTVVPFKAFGLAELFRIIICGLIFLTVGLYINGLGRLRLLLDVLLVVGGLVSIISLASVGGDAEQHGVTGTFGTHETLGSFLMLLLPLALALSLTDIGEQRRQIFAQGVTLLVAAALLMSNTRSAWLGSAASLCVLSLLYWRFPLEPKQARSSPQSNSMQIGPAIILAAALVLFILASHHGGDILRRAKTVTDLSNDVSAQIRHRMAIGAIHMIELKPLFGWGIGSYPMLSSQFVHYGDTPQQIARTGLTLRNNAHDFYLQFAAEQGLIGLFIYFSVIVTFIVVCCKSLASLDKGLQKLAVIGCLAATVGQVVDALTSPSYNLPSVSMFQFLILGIGILAAKGLALPAATGQNS